MRLRVRTAMGSFSVVLSLFVLGVGLVKDFSILGYVVIISGNLGA